VSKSASFAILPDNLQADLSVSRIVPKKFSPASLQIQMRDYNFGKLSRPKIY
jgi:hypothetical protein